MMKIAYIMSRFPKLTETFVLYEMLSVEQFGIPIEIYPLLRHREPVLHPESQPLVKRAHYRPVLSWAVLQAQFYFLRRRPLTYLKTLAEVLAGTFGSLNFFLGALGIFPKVVRFAYEMQKQGITHVHAHFANHPAVAALIIHRLTGIPFSFTAHGSDLHVEKRMLDRKVQAAGFVVTVSNYNREVIVREAGETCRNKVHVIHCGVDPQVFGLLRKPGQKRDFRILSIGSLEEVKGHRYLIEACRLLQDRGIAFRCHIIGQGRLRERLQGQISKLGLTEQVHLLGARPRQEVLRFLAEAEAFVLASVPTSTGKREGIPVALMEAMASGLPVVGSRLSGVPELIESGRSGFLVPPGDARALADRLEQLVREPELGEKLGRAGYETIMRDFNLHKSARDLIALFSGSIASREALTVQSASQPEWCHTE